MSGGIEWFRWWHGTVGDRKIIAVASRSKQPRPLVIATWAALLETASDSSSRGVTTHCDAAVVAGMIGANPDEVEPILAEMAEIDMIHIDGDTLSIVAWSQRQPATEAERARDYRRRHAASRQRNDAVVKSSRVEKRREEERREEDSTSNPSSTYGKTLARDTEEKIVLARKIVGHFDEVRVETFGEDCRRAKPSRNDLSMAEGWVEAGATEALCIAVFESGFDDKKSAGEPPIDALAYFNAAVRKVLAARQPADTTPRREYTPEEAERIRLDTWVRMSPGHGDRDDAWPSMRHPRPTPEQVAEARRRLGFDPPPVDPASGKSP